MLDRNMLRENLDSVQERLSGKAFELDRDAFLALDQEERSVRQEWEESRALRNKTSDEIAEMKKAGEDAGQKIQEMKQVSARIKGLDERIKSLEAGVRDLLSEIPNLPHPSVPVGPDELANTVVREVGAIPEFDFKVKDHVDLGASLGILDPERASKITGARFTNYYGDGALLERALINFMLHVHVREHGYREILPPFMANRASFFGTGNLPKFEEELFHVSGTDYFLIPTGEVPVTNVFANEILAEENLPINFVA
ncbi:MAG: serine--tRNA ligase, partial [Acidobacteriota bacterium]